MPDMPGSSATTPTAPPDGSTSNLQLMYLLQLLQQQEANATAASNKTGAAAAGQTPGTTAANSDFPAGTTADQNGMSITTAPGPAFKDLGFGVFQPGPLRSTTNANGTFSILPEGLNVPRGNSAGGNSGYGYQGPGNQLSQSDSNLYDSIMGNYQLNELISGLANDKALFAPAPAAAAASTAPAFDKSKMTITLPTATNAASAAYTAPALAQAPGMAAALAAGQAGAGGSSLPNAPVPGSLPSLSQAQPSAASSLDAGTITPKQILANSSGPLQASTQPGVTVQNFVPQLNMSGGPATSGTIAQATPATNTATTVASSPPINPYTHILSDRYAPRAPQDLSASANMSAGSQALPSGITGVTGYMPTASPYGSTMAAAGGQGYLPGATPQGNPISGPTVVPAAGGGYTTDPNVPSYNQPTSDVSAGGGASAAGYGGAIASGIGQIGAALAKAYTPIKLPEIKQVEQPKSPIFYPPTIQQSQLV
jgi:hypothetical protein